MSKEKQCKCCREWWYASDIKEDLCPNCYDYFKQLKQELEIKNQKIKNLYIDLKDWEDLEEKISTKYENVVSLLKEKDKEIERLKNLFKLNNEVVINQGKEIFDLRVQVLQQKQNQTQLAIQELEKVKDTLKHFCEIHSDEFYGVKSQVKGIEQDVCEEIDNQIKVLKGE